MTCPLLWSQACLVLMALSLPCRRRMGPPRYTMQPPMATMRQQRPWLCTVTVTSKTATATLPSMWLHQKVGCMGA